MWGKCGKFEGQRLGKQINFITGPGNFLEILSILIMNNARPLRGLLLRACLLRSCHRCHKWLIVFSFCQDMRATNIEDDGSRKMNGAKFIENQGRC